MATSAERQRRFRKNKQRAGKAQVNLYLSRPAVEELDRRKTKEGTRDEVVESLLLKPATSDAPEIEDVGPAWNRLPKIVRQRISEQLYRDVQGAIHEQVKVERKRLGELLEETERSRLAARENLDATVKARRGVKAFMNDQEYKLVLGCLHSDKESSPERKNKAFAIFKRMREAAFRVKV